MSLLNNRQSFTRERDALKERIKQGSKALFRSQWPINPFDDYDYQKEISFLVEKSGVKIFEEYYKVNIAFLHLQKMKKNLIPLFEKYTPEIQNKLKENAPHLKLITNNYQKHIEYIDYYLSSSNNLIENLKIYVNDEFKVKLSEASLSEPYLFVKK